MDIRKIQLDDAYDYLDMLLNLDKETKFMMYEEGERPTDINIAKNIIEKSTNRENLILIATEENSIVGFLSVQRGVPKRIRHTGYIVVGIREKFRGMGIGGKLFLELDVWARENNITRVELSVISSNTVAKHLYEKNGFIIEGIKKNAMIIDGKYVDEFSMAKLYNNSANVTEKKSEVHEAEIVDSQSKDIYKKCLINKNLTLITGGIELIDNVCNLWNKLNRHHESKSRYFKSRFSTLKFEDRKSKFISDYNLDVKIDLIKDVNKGLYIGYCISTINKELVGKIDSLFIDEDYRKFSLGDLLMKRALEWLNNKQAKTKIIIVAEGNESVLEFYKKSNFYTKNIVLEQI